MSLRHHRRMPAHAQPSEEARRNETPAEKDDRNWNELLQELRVTQTGVQILTGFLLTVPFQQKFAQLDDYQVRIYLITVTLAVVTTGLIVAPVPIHRLLFRRRLKREIVDDADRLARIGLIALATVIAGTTLLIFDVVVSREAGWGAGGLTLSGLIGLWLVLPLRLAQRRNPR